MPFSHKASKKAEMALGELQAHRIKVYLDIPATAKDMYIKQRTTWLRELEHYHTQMRMDYLYRGVLHKIFWRFMRSDLREMYIADVQCKLAWLRREYYSPEKRLLRNLKGYP